MSHPAYEFGSVSTFLCTRLKICKGVVGGEMVLGKRPAPGRLTYFGKSKARAYYVYSSCGLGLCGHFSRVYHFSRLSPSLWETARYRLKYCLKGPLNPNQQTKQNQDLYMIYFFGVSVYVSFL